MKILILSPRFPYPVLGGDVLRIINIAEQLSENNSVDLLSFKESSISNDDVSSLREKSIFRNVEVVHRNRFFTFLGVLSALLRFKPIQAGYYYSPLYSTKLKKMIKENDYDLIVVHLIRLAPYIDKLKLHNKTILEMTDAISLNYTRALSRFKGIKRSFFSLEKRLLYRYEMKCIDKFKKTVLVSEVDKAYLGDNESVAVIKNGYTSDFHNLQRDENNEIVFIGNMRSNANHDMVMYFLDEMLPNIRKEKPDIVFKVIGAEPRHELIQRSIKDDFIVTGRVDRIEDHLTNAALSICPMTLGAGIQNKILESLAYGIPVVATSYGAEGIIQDNCDFIVVENEPKRFAEKVVETINNAEFRVINSQKAIDFIKKNFSWQNNLKTYLQKQLRS